VTAFTPASVRATANPPVVSAALEIETAASVAEPMSIESERSRATTLVIHGVRSGVAFFSTSARRS
jgi:hypothetical protein